MISYRKVKKTLSLISLIFVFFLSLIQVWKNFQMQSQVLGEDDERGYEQALVEEVIDGDTIRLSDGRKVRYIGVDTPETKDPRVGQECFGKEASEHNRQLVEGKIVSLEKDVSETDRYGRLLRYVWLEDVLVNKLLVEEGYAFARSFPPDIAKQDELKEAERQAREKQLGLWGVCELNDVDKINELIKAADETSQD